MIQLLNSFSKVVRYLHLWTSSILLVSAGLQTLTFVLLARILGIQDFGHLMIYQAATQLALEFVSLGAGEAFIRRVARSADAHRRAFGHATLMIGITWPPVGIVVFVLLTALAPTTLMAAALGVYVFGELLGNRLSILSEQVCIAHSQITIANFVRLIPILFRSIIVLAWFLFYKNDVLANWVLIQGSTTAISGICCLSLIILRFGRPLADFDRSDFKFGLLSTGLHLANSIQFTADRLVLAGVATPITVAIYSAATRAIQLAYLPVAGVLRNLFAGFFRAGIDGVAASRDYAYRNLPRVASVGLLSGVCLVIGADFLPVVLGRDFIASTSILRELCAVPLLQGVQYLLADALSGSDNQGHRLALGAFSAAIYLVIISILSYFFKITGLIVGIYIFQILMIFGCIGIVQRVVTLSVPTNTKIRT